jgi:hypothetical protein
MTVEEAEERLKDYLLYGIAAEVHFADEAYALAEEIGQHVPAIRAAGFESLFGTLQVLLSERQTLSVTKLFDRPNKHPTRSHSSGARPPEDWSGIVEDSRAARPSPEVGRGGGRALVRRAVEQA